MSRILRRRPSPAMVVAFVALCVALAGTASALPGRARVKKDDIARAAVRAQHIYTNAVRTKHIRARNVTRSKIARRAINSDLVGLDALTGENIVESSLSTVPNASKVNDRSVQKIAFVVGAGTAATQVLNLSGLTLTAACAAGPALSVTAGTTVSGAILLVVGRPRCGDGVSRRRRSVQHRGQHGSAAARRRRHEHLREPAVRAPGRRGPRARRSSRRRRRPAASSPAPRPASRLTRRPGRAPHRSGRVSSHPARREVFRAGARELLYLRIGTSGRGPSLVPDSSGLLCASPEQGSREIRKEPNVPSVEAPPLARDDRGDARAIRGHGGNRLCSKQASEGKRGIGADSQERCPVQAHQGRLDHSGQARAEHAQRVACPGSGRHTGPCDQRGRGCV